MQQLGPVLAIGGMIALVGGIIWLAWYMEKKRTEAMSAYAQSHGFQFEGPAQQLIDELSMFKLFNQGRARTAKNLMRGAKDVGSIRICDYQFTTGSGKHQQVHHQTICVLKTPGRQVPHFFLRRQRAIFDALGKVFGGQDINFEDDPAFSKAYVLQCSGDENQLRGFMSPGLRDSLTRLADHNLVIEVVGDTMVLHQGKRLKPDQLEGLVTHAVNIRRQWS